MCSRACATALLHGDIAWDHIAWAVGLNVVWLGVAALLVFAGQFRAARVRGALLNIGE